MSRRFGFALAGVFHSSVTGSIEEKLRPIPERQTLRLGEQAFGHQRILSDGIQSYPDPSVSAQAFMFNTGQVINGQPQYNPVLPNIGEPVSTTWAVSQWSASEYFQPDKWTSGDSSFADPTLGLPAYTWRTPDGSAAFNLYQSQTSVTAFGLYTNAGNGASTFLSTLPSDGIINLGQLVTYTINAKIGYASGFGGATTSETGFTLLFNAPGTQNYDPSLPTETGFLQYMITDSRGIAAFLAKQTANGQFIVNANFPANVYLPYATDGGALHSIGYDINAGVAEVAAYIVQVLNLEGTPEAAKIEDQARWYIGSVYVGNEGVAVPVQLDFSDPSLVAHPGVSWNASAFDSVTGAQNYATSTVGTNFSFPDVGPVQITSNGPDTVEGGYGPLTVVGAGSSVTVQAGVGSALVKGTASLFFQGSASSATVASSGADTICQGSGPILENGSNLVRFIGGAGPATIAGTASSSESLKFIGSSGSATVWGGGGNETLIGGTGTLVDSEGTGSQTVFGGMGQSSVAGGSGSLTLVESYRGSVEVTGGSGRATLWANGGSISCSGGTGSIVLIGGSLPSERLSFAAGPGSSTVWGGAGNETLRGGGASFLDCAGVGNQLVQVGDGHQVIFCGSGTVSVEGGAYAHPTIVGGPGLLSLDLGGSAADVWLGSRPGTYALGSAWNSLIVAGATSQTVEGGAHGDFLAASKVGGDQLTATGQGVTAAIFQGGNDTVDGSTGGGSIVVGGVGNDVVVAGAGEAVWDVTDGPIVGRDVGATTWVFAEGRSGDATISDFKPGRDSIWLTGPHAQNEIKGLASGTTILLADGHSVTLLGINEAALQGSIHFV